MTLSLALLVHTIKKICRGILMIAQEDSISTSCFSTAHRGAAYSLQNHGMRTADKSDHTMHGPHNALPAGLTCRAPL